MSRGARRFHRLLEGAIPRLAVEDTSLSEVPSWLWNL